MEVPFYRSPGVVHGNFVFGAENWQSAVKSHAHSAFGPRHENSIPLARMLGVKFDSDTPQNDAVLEVDDETFGSTSLMMREESGVKVASLYAFAKIDLLVWNYGDGIDRMLRTHLIGTLSYSSYHGMQPILEEGLRVMLNAYENEHMDDDEEEDQARVEIKPFLHGRNATLILSNYSRCDDHELIRRCTSLSNNAYILCKQPSYAKLNAMVMEKFAFPSVPAADTLQCNQLYSALTTQGPNQYLTERLNRKVFMVSRHIDNNTETGKLWLEHVTKLEDDLNRLRRLLATVMVTNYRMRRMLIDKFVLWSCNITDSMMTMDYKPGVPATLRSHRAGCGVLHNILNDRVVIWNQPMPEDVMYEPTTDSDVVYDNVEDEEGEEECSDEYKVYVQKRMKRSEAECAYQGLGGAHDLLFVEGRARRVVAGAGSGAGSGDVSADRKRSTSSATDTTSKHARTESTEHTQDTQHAEYTLKPSADSAEEPPLPPLPPLPPALPMAPYIKPQSVLVVSTGHHYRAFCVTAPTEAGAKPAVHYGDEIDLPVLHKTPRGERLSWAGNSGASPKQTCVDRNQVLRVLCLLALACTDAYKPVPIGSDEVEEFGSEEEWVAEKVRLSTVGN